MGDNCIYPDWAAPAHVKAVSTTRAGGISVAPFNSLNLGTHVGDQDSAVELNRARLRSTCGFDSEPVWLQQTHSTIVHPIMREQSSDVIEADASVTSQVGRVCAVMTADCLPILLTDIVGNQVAAVHVGWRGLASGIIEATVAHFHCDVEHILAWLGPCIGPAAFEIGTDVANELGGPKSAYQAHVEPGKLYADLPQLAGARLTDLGVRRIWQSNLCTFSDEERFFSYRRDGKTGRMATLIWLENH